MLLRRPPDGLSPTWDAVLAGSPLLYVNENETKKHENGTFLRRRKWTKKWKKWANFTYYFFQLRALSVSPLGD